jgi:drug/metabolite transporter (DMT)-like permease
MQVITTKMNFKQWLLLLFLATIWGASFFLMELVLVDLTSFELVFYRLFLAMLFLWAVVWVKGLFDVSYFKLWREFIIMGLVNNVLPFSLIAYAQITINASLASILNATVPFFAIIFATLLLSDEKITIPKLLGVVIGFIGVSYIIGFDISSLDLQVLAIFAMLGATLCYGLATVYGRKFNQLGVPPIVMATMQISIASIILALVIILTDNSFIPSFSLNSSLAILALSIISTGVAYIIYFYLLENAGAVNTSLVTFLVPISAIFLSTWLLGEILQTKHIIGAMIIFLGLIVIDGRLFKR